MAVPGPALLRIFISSFRKWLYSQISQWYPTGRGCEHLWRVGAEFLINCRNSPSQQDEFQQRSGRWPAVRQPVGMRKHKARPSRQQSSRNDCSEAGRGESEGPEGLYHIQNALATRSVISCFPKKKTPHLGLLLFFYPRCYWRRGRNRISFDNFLKSFWDNHGVDRGMKALCTVCLSAKEVPRGLSESTAEFFVLRFIFFSCYIFSMHPSCTQIILTKWEQCFCSANLFSETTETSSWKGIYNFTSYTSQKKKKKSCSDGLFLQFT